MKRWILLAMLSTAALAGSWSEIFERKKGIEPVRSTLYDQACGECHFAYQPGWLPARSWEKMMRPEELEDHFGDNAELMESERLEVLKFLVENSAESSRYKRSRKIMAAIKAHETPLRISQTRYLDRKHSEIPLRLIEQEKVRSLAHCGRCHEGADKGNFDDDDVVIPNYGRWDN
jgi:hypothetical protein